MFTFYPERLGFEFDLEKISFWGLSLLSVGICWYHKTNPTICDDCCHLLWRSKNENNPLFSCSFPFLEAIPFDCRLLATPNLGLTHIIFTVQENWRTILGKANGRCFGCIVKRLPWQPMWLIAWLTAIIISIAGWVFIGTDLRRSHTEVLLVGFHPDLLYPLTNRKKENQVLTKEPEGSFLRLLGPLAIPDIKLSWGWACWPLRGATNGQPFIEELLCADRFFALRELTN